MVEGDIVITSIEDVIIFVMLGVMEDLFEELLWTMYLGCPHWGRIGS